MSSTVDTLGKGERAARTRLARAGAVATAALLLTSFVLVALAGGRAADVGSIGLREAIALSVPWLAFAVVGALIVGHRPDNTVGWLCSIAGLQVSVVALTVGIATYALSLESTSTIGVAAAWAAHTGSITLVLAPLLILYRFPTGRPLGPPWRMAEVLTILIVSVMVVLAAVDPSPLLTFPSTPNPLGIGEASRMSPTTFIPAVACAAIPIAALVVRFRHGTTIERRQIRLLASAGVLVAIAMATMTLTSPQLMGEGRLSALTAVVNAVAFASIPIAIGIAIVRDRLYDIDRIVNRTIVYAIVTAVLAGTYTVAVITLSAVLTAVAAESRGTLVVAGATLVAAAFFRPVRMRAQRAVDRRFDRERYEATRSIDAFASIVRGEVELDAIVDDLQETAARTVHPSTATCWIRPQAT